MGKIIKLEKVTGAVALAYLVLIPAAGYVAFRKIQDLDADINLLWDDDIPPRKGVYQARFLAGWLLNKKG